MKHKTGFVLSYEYKDKEEGTVVETINNLDNRTMVFPTKDSAIIFARTKNLEQISKGDKNTFLKHNINLRDCTPLEYQLSV